MAKQNLDWANIGFAYRKTDMRYVAAYRNGAWEEGTLTADDQITMTECAGVLQYAQTCFEGLKAYETANGDVVCFRPDLNAERMIASCRRLMIPEIPKEMFLTAIREVVRANLDWVPPYGSGASLYIRPYVFGKSAVIGVKPAEEYEFRVFVTPVGPYFKGDARPISLKVSDYDRAAPHGLGNIKAGANYAAALFMIENAHEEGYAENLYLDPATHTLIEETGGSNVFFVDKDRTIIIPHSKTDSILPSITRRSIVQVARDVLRLQVTEREVALSEIASFAEMGACGTAAVISPVGMVHDHGKEIVFPNGMEQSGPVVKELYDTLTGMQLGTVEAPEGWIFPVAEA
ncbi:MAG: branched-chain amino acid aminotransferase [Lachnospiraceae bacterium]|nr:branched-chain amino acid aminotransferase [Lachnospiraceae bacterium]